MEKKKSNILAIIILCILLTVCIGYIVYDKTNENQKPSNNNETIAYDLDKAKDLVDKYYVETDKFEIESVLFAYNQLKNIDVRFGYCDILYDSKDRATKNEDLDNSYFIKDRDISGMCDGETYYVNYEVLNKEYKKLFKKELPKNDVEIQREVGGIFILDYDEEENIFINLDCRCGGASMYQYLYDVISAEIKNNKLIVEVGVAECTYSDTGDGYSVLIDNDKRVYTEKEARIEGFFRPYLTKHKDSKEIKKYTFTFNRDDNEYYLENLVEQK